VLEARVVLERPSAQAKDLIWSNSWPFVPTSSRFRGMCRAVGAPKSVNQTYCLLETTTAGLLLISRESVDHYVAAGAQLCLNTPLIPPANRNKLLHICSSVFYSTLFLAVGAAPGGKGQAP
jgi:hypothetical protein